MKDHYSYDNKHEFVAKLKELVESGVPKKRINTFTPFHVHEAEELLDTSQSPVRFFQGVGAVTGLVAGFAFTLYTIKAWPLVTGGKPLYSIIPLMIIAYELTILLGCLLGFGGFLLLARLPAVGKAFSTKRETEFTNYFEIWVQTEDRR